MFLPACEPEPLPEFSKVGNQNIIAVKTQMVAFNYGGSATKANIFKVLTGATGIIQLGMAFGTIPSKQKIGDVLVSKDVFPYDNCTIKSSKMCFSKKYIIDYTNTKRYPSKRSLLNTFTKYKNYHGYKVFFLL